MKTEVAWASDPHLGQVRVSLCHGDLPEAFLLGLNENSVVAIDIETSGLDFRIEQIGSIQVFDGHQTVCVVRPPYLDPLRLGQLLADVRVKKVFHHAMFDLRFLRSQLRLQPKNVACTKIAAKIVYPEVERHSLSDLLRAHLNVELDKSLQVSNWMSVTLSTEQLAYAVRDVIYLKRLLNRLLDVARERRVIPLVKESFEYLPTRVELELLGIKDVFTY